MALNQELVYLIIQFLKEEGHERTVHLLESETQVFFDLNYFEELVLNGNWDELESYLSGFTKFDENKYSTKIFFEIRKQRFLEALDEKDHHKALDILITYLKVFSQFDEELFKEMAYLLTLNDFREHDSLCQYGDTKSARLVMKDEVQKIIEANPSFHGKLQFPCIKDSRLRRLINQSLNWQHTICEHPSPNPKIKTLFEDHICPQPNELTIHTHSFVPSAPSSALPASQSSSPPASTCSVVSHGMSGFHLPPFPVILFILVYTLFEAPAVYEGPKDMPNMSKTCSTVAMEKSQKISDKFDDLPCTVGRILNLGSHPVSMDFHPIRHTSLLVGTNIGDIELWEVVYRTKLFSRNFRVWDIGTCSMAFKATFMKNPSVNVNRVVWNSDGSSFGVAYSNHIVQLYACSGIDAHTGSVNDLAFSKPGQELLVITCGDDRLVKVWDVATGDNLLIFEGHKAPVYSICAHNKKKINYIFSTAIDGAIKAWLYDSHGPRVEFDAPSKCCMKMVYSKDGKRLFSCGTAKSGKSIIVEWDDSDGCVKHSYEGLVENSSRVLHFDTAKNQFLAAGDDFLIKFWDMDAVELLMAIDADGGLPGSPYLCFNKRGTLLAVSANDDQVKILADEQGIQMLQNMQYDIGTVNVPGDLSESLNKIVEIKDMEVARFTSVEEMNVESKVERSEIIDTVRCQSFWLPIPEDMQISRISRLTYTNAGYAILALASNGNHLLWKWLRKEANPSGMATAKVSPELWKSKRSSPSPLMTKKPSCSNPEEVVSCFALSKNDSYVVSASGGDISLYNMLTLKEMRTFCPAPPAATFIALHPRDNNVIAIGRADSTVVIYNIRIDEVQCTLEGHTGKISGLIFSFMLNLLVSVGVDSQVIVWSTDSWKKENSTFLQIPDGKSVAALTDPSIQLHGNQAHFLAVHETHLALYEASTLLLENQWVPGELSAAISHATYSCNSELVYAGFTDGALLVLDASVLQPKYRIDPSAYRTSEISLNSYPLVIAAHTSIPNQLAVGFSEGGVCVLEPLESEGKWGAATSFAEG
ncbi:WD40 repeat [Dillenia turbinata]|uniref:WD40 repeat n=1 Tax=Dillenia turbinata TaxID=194707 RepID=A0AAN8VH71_9MAGN